MPACPVGRFGWIKYRRSAGAKTKAGVYVSTNLPTGQAGMVAPLGLGA